MGVDEDVLATLIEVASVLQRQVGEGRVSQSRQCSSRRVQLKSICRTVEVRDMGDVEIIDKLSVGMNQDSGWTVGCRNRGSRGLGEYAGGLVDIENVQETIEQAA